MDSLLFKRSFWCRKCVQMHEWCPFCKYDKIYLQGGEGWTHFFLLVLLLWKTSLNPWIMVFLWKYGFMIKFTFMGLDSLFWRSSFCRGKCVQIHECCLFVKIWKYDKFHFQVGWTHFLCKRSFVGRKCVQIHECCSSCKNMDLW